MGGWVGRGRVGGQARATSSRVYKPVISWYSVMTGEQQCGTVGTIRYAQLFCPPTRCMHVLQQYVPPAASKLSGANWVVCFFLSHDCVFFPGLLCRYRMSRRHKVLLSFVELSFRAGLVCGRIGVCARQAPLLQAVPHPR